MPIGFILSGCISIYVLCFASNTMYPGQGIFDSIDIYKVSCKSYISSLRYIVFRLLVFVNMLLYLLSYINRYHVIYAIILSCILMSFYIWQVKVRYILYSFCIVCSYMLFNIFISTSASIIVVYSAIIILLFGLEYSMGLFTEIILISISIIIQSGEYMLNAYTYYFDVNIHIDALMISIVMFNLIYIMNKGNRNDEKSIGSSFDCMGNIYRL